MKCPRFPAALNGGWFNFELYSWLAVKQIIVFLILVLVGFSIKRSLSFKKQLKSEDEDTVSDQTRTAWKKAYKLSLIIYLLVVINPLLGLFKPL